MKKILILLAVAMLPAASGCCCTRLCPFCPCNWFARTAPAPVCAPAPTYVAPMATTCPPSPCAPAAVAPMAATMPQFMAPPTTPVITQAQPTFSQPMYYQQPAMTPAYYAEPSCSYASEPSCGGPSMVSYAPMSDCGTCGSCSSCGTCGSCTTCNSGCSDGGATTSTSTPTPEKFVEPAPAAD